MRRIINILMTGLDTHERFTIEMRFLRVPVFSIRQRKEAVFLKKINSLKRYGVYITVEKITWHTWFQVVISKRMLQTPQGSSLYMYLYHTTFDILNMQ